jgi:hypothetical protein
MKKLLIAFLALLYCVSLSAADGFSSLEEQMTGNEFSAAGLDKLTPEELKALNQWIRARSLATLATSPASVAATSAVTGNTGASSADETAGVDRRGFRSEKKDEDRTPITSRIVGKFSGWDGQTVFKLENGMIWEQADKDKFFIREVENPVAVIEPGIFGTWRLHIEGFNSECRVERIQ